MASVWKSRREGTRLTRLVRTAMSGLSSGTYTCSGEGSRFLRGGVGERSFCLKKVRILPCFFFCGVALEPFVGATSMGISSSVDGADEREESESAMLGLLVVVVVGVAAAQRGSNDDARLGTYEVISPSLAPVTAMD
jgi:hypothetical protein